jgi:hypothetical protein
MDNDRNSLRDTDTDTGTADDTLRRQRTGTQTGSPSDYGTTEREGYDNVTTGTTGGIHDEDEDEDEDDDELVGTRETGESDGGGIP